MLLQKIHFPYSIKNITISTQQAFRSKLVAKTEEFINRLRWHVLFKFVYEKSTETRRNTYGFKSLNRAPVVDCLKDFERDLWLMVREIKWKEKKNF